MKISRSIMFFNGRLFVSFLSGEWPSVWKQAWCVLLKYEFSSRLIWSDCKIPSPCKQHWPVLSGDWGTKQTAEGWQCCHIGQMGYFWFILGRNNSVGDGRWNLGYFCQHLVLKILWNNITKQAFILRSNTDMKLI